MSNDNVKISDDADDTIVANPTVLHPTLAPQVDSLKARLSVLPLRITDATSGSFQEYRRLARLKENARDDQFDAALAAETGFVDQEKFMLVELAADAADVMDRLLLALLQVCLERLMCKAIEGGATCDGHMGTIEADPGNYRLKTGSPP